MNDRFTVIIADDHEIVRDGLRAALTAPGVVEEDGLRVVAEACNGLEALAAVKEHKPDLLLLDLNMPYSGGADVLIDVRRWAADTKVVVFSSVENAALLGSLIDQGVEGMFAKGAANTELYEKLPLILRGGRYVSLACLALIDARTDLPDLTPRESQTLNMVLKGRTTKEIADAQGVSPRTAEKHRASMMSKLGVHSIAELMAKALEHGLIDD